MVSKREYHTCYLRNLTKKFMKEVNKEYIMKNKTNELIFEMFIRAV